MKAFVADSWSEPEENLSTDTSLNVDLGMDGNDALEFAFLFSFFRVDLTDFAYDKQFRPEEGANPFSIIEAQGV